MKNKIDFEVINFGRSGKTATMNVSDSYVDLTAFKEALHSHPDIVVLMLGTNDAKNHIWDEDKFIRDYTDICKDFLKVSKQLYLMVPPPLY